MLTSYHNGTYVAWRLRNDSKYAFESWLSQSHIVPQLGYNLWEYHATIIHSPHVTLENVARGQFDPIFVAPKNQKWKFLTNTEQKLCLVLQLDCEAMQVRHNELKSLGAAHSHIEYIPHVTVCYRLKTIPDLSALPLPTLPIVFDFEYQLPIS